MFLDEKKKKKIAKRQKIYRKNNCTSIINKLNHATVELDNKIRSVPACNDNIDDNKLSVQAWHLPFLLAA
jgi:phage terminase large subunit